MKHRPTYEELQDRVANLEQLLQQNSRNGFNAIGIRSLFETDIVAYSITRLHDGVYLEANPGFQKISGYSREEILGQSSQQLGLVTAEQRLEILKDIRLLGRLENKEIHFNSKNGDPKTALFSSSEITFKGEKCLYTTLVDITDRKIIEEQIKESESLHRLTLSNVNDTVILTDAKGKMTFCCPNVHFITGYSDKEVMRWKNIYQLIGDDLYNEEMLQERGELQNIEKDIVTKNGDICHTLIGVKRIRFKNSTKLYTIHDITELKKLQNNLVQSQKMESLGNLAGGIAHDFNNLLSAIIGFTELSLGDIGSDSTIRENLEEVSKASIRARDLVQQILTFTRQQEADAKAVNLFDIVEETLKFLRSSIPATIEIRKNLLSNAMVLGAEVEFSQIIMNLCANSAQAMEHQGGILDISMCSVEHYGDPELENLGLDKGEYIEIKVTDTGKGIPRKYIERVFEPYFTTKALGEGTGMGLALVHSLVESYGGKIHLESMEGIGTEVSIYLPVVKEHQVEEQEEYEHLPGGHERILFIDDEPSVVKVSCSILKSLGYKVVSASNGLEALEIFKQQSNVFDLVITDMTMPNMKGDELAVELVKIRPDIAVILLTGHMKKMAEQDYTQRGIRAVFYKPMTMDLLAKAVRKVLDEAALLDSLDSSPSSSH